MGEVKPGVAPRVLVTGGGVRLGAAMARAFAAEGCDVAIHCHRSRGPADAVAAEARAFGRDARVYQADLSAPDGPADLAEQVGAVDVLINSAAAWSKSPAIDVDVAAWEAMQALNCRAPFMLARALYPHLRQSALPGGGVILNITDIAAARPVPGYAHYCVAKAGLDMITRALALEWAGHVRVNAIAPGTVLAPEGLEAGALAGIIDTIPMGRVGTADDIASAAIYLALRAPYVTGQSLAVDGGRSVGGPMQAG